MPSPFEFRAHGESGVVMSELFPHLDLTEKLRSAWARMLGVESAPLTGER